MASLGIILLGLLRTPLRWCGAAALVFAVSWALAVPQPDILISADGHNVAVRGKDGRLHLMRTRPGCVSAEGVAGRRRRPQAIDRCHAHGRRLMR